MVIGVTQLTRSLKPIPLVRLLGKEIIPVTVAKDLGVTIESSLTYNEHITKAVSNCMHRSVRIDGIKHLLEKKMLPALINAFVFSKPFYCSTVRSNTSKPNVKRLQLVQNFAGRIVLGLRKYDHISVGLNSLKWLTIADKLLLNESIHYGGINTEGKIPECYFVVTEGIFVLNFLFNEGKITHSCLVERRKFSLLIC